jgi:uncharacterized protein (UPF0332 family)
MNYNAFLTLGKELIENEPVTEVKIRTSISRGYNYAFHHVRENCRSHPDSHFNNGKGDHREAIEFLKRIEQGTLASHLLSLTDKRNNAEYDLKLNYKKEKAIEYIDDAEDFVGRFDRDKINILKRKIKQKKIRRR